ncbi:hypothetical protein SARC_04184 [Sphaeroforma arctica JP610]|uniref:Uncharacterized protein n=1 Tax=Sphaeroforma arctica JP610 TaxID=667725 RepID=A0A0L0G3D7_9EUKA|nr:hypothetical protein SARC_04184 [Sphaeroforma arctica JP610]KNC83560.1 hypothetical protein SARC_04184 [Sphaeroforma arctica JP610]|eukprot:XP_014157462.1 hypothetical protein SARC_04184 [Sphaeroforma arctica JP610]
MLKSAESDIGVESSYMTTQPITATSALPIAPPIASDADPNHFFVPRHVTPDDRHSTSSVHLGSPPHLTHHARIDVHVHHDEQLIDARAHHKEHVHSMFTTPPTATGTSTVTLTTRSGTCTHSNSLYEPDTTVRDTTPTSYQFQPSTAPYLPHERQRPRL